MPATRPRLALCAALGASLAAPAARAEGLDVGQAVALALRQAPEVLATRERVAAAAGRLVQARLWPRRNPEVEGEWADDRPMAAEGERAWRLAVSQDLEIGGQADLRAAVAAREVEAARLEVEAFERAYAGRVRNAFYALLAAERADAIAGEIVRVHEGLLAASARRLAAGDIAEAEHNLLAVEVERARADVAAAQADVGRAGAELSRLLGRPAAEPVSAQGELPAGPGADDGPPAADAGRRDVQAAREAAEARTAEVALLRQEVVPDLRLSLGWERDVGVVGPEDLRGGATSPAGVGFSDTDDLVVLGLSVPLPLFNRNEGAIAEAAARGAEARLRATALAQAADAEVAAARAEVAAAARRLALYAAVLPLVDRNQELLARAFAAGQVDTTALLAAQDRAFRTRRDHVDAQRGYATARVALALAFGGDPVALHREAR